MISLLIFLNQLFDIINIRSKRERPGLQPQHIVTIEAAAKICHARIVGANRNSPRLVFIPGKIVLGKYHFDIGTAGSTTLVLQTLLPLLTLADAPSIIYLHGGTHNPFAPPYVFISQSFFTKTNRRILFHQSVADVEKNLSFENRYVK